MKKHESKTLNIAIVEDNDEDAATLKKFITDCFSERSFSYNIDKYENPVIFSKTFDSKYNIIFLDIEMPGLNGMELARRIRAADRDVVIVFTTAMAQYAIEGYEVNAFDYIVKPFAYPLFAVKFKRILDTFKLSKGGEIWIKAVGLKQNRIDVSELKYVEVIKHDCIYHTTHGDYRVIMSMTKACEELKDYPFALCNQCFLVNLEYVTEVTADTVVCGGDRLPISRAKRKEFMRLLNNYFARGTIDD